MVETMICSKKIQKAYDTLGNIKLRKQYDSQEPFDNSIPTAADVTEDNFFEVLAPYFDRNAKWSTKKRVPQLGNMETTWKQVQKFYEFWFNFQSWRDFSYEDEYDLEEAESREEKRWMDRRNQKIRSKFTTEERSRIRSLVNMAYKKDPRVIKQKSDEKEEREERIRRRKEARKNREEERKRMEEEKIRQREAEEMARKEALDNEMLEMKKRKRVLLKRKKKLRVFSQKFDYNPEKIEYLIERYNLDDINNLFLEFEGKGKKKIFKILDDAFDELKEEISNRSKKDVVVEKTQEEIEQELLSWSKEEVDLLTKAVKKYPVGLRQRWEQIQSFIGTKRSIKEIRRMVEYTSSGKRTHGWDNSHQNTEKYNLPAPSQNYEYRLEYNVPILVVPPDLGFYESVTNWSQESQNQLQDAIKEIGSVTREEDWVAISERVDNRTYNDCILRYKYIVAVVKENN
eukprot:TRINITY_DN2563_c0_g3_i2.p1 TRINITY_DN2563_c0_g3~~TRINITY_DN2563_c0_g3_i2.p1  ORF type:complete len:457 (-),score=128.78 TRINITY_DN2563_c0_g3_i2:32-1402(-)